MALSPHEAPRSARQPAARIRKEVNVPIRTVLTALFITSLMTSCTSTTTTAFPTSPAADCERNRGAWRAVVDYCEYGAAR